MYQLTKFFSLVDYWIDAQPAEGRATVIHKKSTMAFFKIIYFTALKYFCPMKTANSWFAFWESNSVAFFFLINFFS